MCIRDRLGNVLVKMQRFPINLVEGEKIVSKLEELKKNVKFQSKKVNCMGTSIATVEQSEE